MGNGRLNLHIMQNAQGCQGGITQIRIQHPSKISNQQKNFIGTQLQGSPQNQHFTAGLLLKQLFSMSVGPYQQKNTAIYWV